MSIPNPFDRKNRNAKASIESKPKLDLRELVKASREANPRLADKATFKSEFFKKHHWRKESQRLTKVHPEYPLWMALALSPHGGDMYYETHHSSSVGVCAEALRLKLVTPDMKSKNTTDFLTWLMGQYDHPNPERQVMDSWNKALGVDNSGTPTSTGEDGQITFGVSPKISEKFDSVLLRQHPRTKIDSLIELSPYENPEQVDPLDFVRLLFTADTSDISSKQTKKAKRGLVCLAEKINYSALIFDPDSDKVRHPLTGEFIEDIDEMRFISRSVFKESSNEKGRRTKDNLGKEVFMVLECDFEGNIEYTERFNTFAYTMAGYAPMVAVVDSGGKSFHFWFWIGDANREALIEFKKHAILHGADPSVINDSTKYVRLPNVKADSDFPDRRNQRLVYFNPDNCQINKARQWNLNGFESALSELKTLEVYYHDTNYYCEAEDKSWFKVRDLKMHLANKGIRAKPLEEEPLSPAQKAEIYIQMNNGVTDVIKKLAGYEAGRYENEDGSSFLVRYNRKFPSIPAEAKGFPNIENYLKEMFEGIQYDIVMTWLSQSVKDCYNDGKRVSKFGPSQMLNIVGQQNAGKTALSKLILPKLFGGRAANGAGLFKQADDIFNTMETGSELLIIDDKSCLKDSEENRQHQGETVKSLLVSGSNEVHGKGADKIAAKTFTRLIRLMNDDLIPTLPMLTEPSVGDKIIVVRALVRGKPKSIEWFDEMEGHVQREIGSFFRHLIQEYVIPEHIRVPEGEGRRFPCISYKDPDIIVTLHDSSKSAFLEHVIASTDLDETAARDGIRCFEGSAVDIYNEIRTVLTGDMLQRFKTVFSQPERMIPSLREMRTMDMSRKEKDRILYYSDHDDIHPKRLNGNHYWRINLPVKEKKPDKLDRFRARKKTVISE